MPEYADTFVYHGGKVVRHGSKIVSVNHHGTVSLDGLPYKTFKVPVNITKDGSFVTLRQEWVVENYNSPMATDLDVSSWTGTDWNRRMRAIFYRASSRQVNAQIPSPSTARDYFRTVLALRSPVSIKLSSNTRIYNSYALNYIDNRYKASGWRVPALEDYKRLSFFWNYDSIITKASLASAMVAGCPDFNGNSFVGFTFRKTAGTGEICYDGTIPAYGSSDNPSLIVEGNLDATPSGWTLIGGSAHLKDTNYNYPGMVWSSPDNSDTSTYTLIRNGYMWPTRSRQNQFAVYKWNYTSLMYNNGARLVLLDRADGAFNGSVVRDQEFINITAGFAVDDNIRSSPAPAETWNFPNFYSVRLVKNLYIPRYI